MAVVGLLCVGCATTRLPNRAAAERERLLAVDAAFSRASEKDGIQKAFLAFAAEDATIMPIGGVIVTGKAKIAENLASFPPGEFEWKATGAEVAASGDLGYTWGKYEFGMKDVDGKIDMHHGKYVTVWRKQADGQWEFVMNIGNPRGRPPIGEEDEEEEEEEHMK